MTKSTIIKWSTHLCGACKVMKPIDDELRGDGYKVIELYADEMTPPKDIKYFPTYCVNGLRSVGYCPIDELVFRLGLLDEHK